MTGAIRYRNAVIEDVPGASWTVAWGWRNSGAQYVSVTRACPDYTSDELRRAVWDALVAEVFGKCSRCGAVAGTDRELKTASADQRVFLGGCPVPHRAGCPCSNGRIQALDRRDSPDGLGTPLDMSEASQNVLAEFLNTMAEAFR